MMLKKHIQEFLVNVNWTEEMFLDHTKSEPFFYLVAQDPELLNKYDVKFPYQLEETEELQKDIDESHELMQSELQHKIEKSLDYLKQKGSNIYDKDDLFFYEQFVNGFLNPNRFTILDKESIIQQRGYQELERFDFSVLSKDTRNEDHAHFIGDYYLENLKIKKDDLKNDPYKTIDKITTCTSPLNN